MWHPNVYPDGTVCISILHAPGQDEYGYEDASERWSPVHSVESILVSVISMLSSPNDESPANIEAAKQYRADPEQFRRRVQRLVRKKSRRNVTELNLEIKLFIIYFCFHFVIFNLGFECCCILDDCAYIGLLH